VALDLLIMHTDPCADLPADRPGGIVPQQHQDPFLRGGQLLAESGEQGGRHMAHRPAVDTSQQHGIAVRLQQPVAGQGFGLSIALGVNLLHQTQGLVGRPPMQGRLGQTTPPGLIGKAQDPVGMLVSPVHQPVAGLFFNAYGGSGLVIQRLARRQFTPSRLCAWRTVSMLT
jgi:hypothetical protein